VKKLLAFMILGSLLAVGCSSSPTTKASKKVTPTPSPSPSPSVPDVKPTTPDVKPTTPTPKPTVKETKKAPVEPVKEPKLSVKGEDVTIAKDKSDGDVKLTVTRTDFPTDAGDVTIKIAAPEGLKVDKDTVILPKDKDDATVKVSVPATAKRDKEETLALKVTATGADGKATANAEVKVKVEKK